MPGFHAMQPIVLNTAAWPFRNVEAGADALECRGVSSRRRSDRPRTSGPAQALLLLLPTATRGLTPVTGKLAASPPPRARAPLPMRSRLPSRTTWRLLPARPGGPGLTYGVRFPPRTPPSVSQHPRPPPPPPPPSPFASARRAATARPLAAAGFRLDARAAPL